MFRSRQIRIVATLFVAILFGHGMSRITVPSLAWTAIAEETKNGQPLNVERLGIIEGLKTLDEKVRKLEDDVIAIKKFTYGEVKFDHNGKTADGNQNPGNAKRLTVECIFPKDRFKEPPLVLTSIERWEIGLNGSRLRWFVRAEAISKTGFILKLDSLANPGAIIQDDPNFGHCHVKWLAIPQEVVQPDLAGSTSNWKVISIEK